MNDSQAYFQSGSWQREERTATAELAAGNYLDFDFAEDAIAWLRST